MFQCKTTNEALPYRLGSLLLKTKYLIIMSQFFKNILQPQAMFLFTKITLSVLKVVVFVMENMACGHKIFQQLGFIIKCLLLNRRLPILKGKLLAPIIQLQKPGPLH